MPFSKLYGRFTQIRNYLYDRQLIKSKRPEVYCICVGNLTVGGTGKTPMIEFLIKRSMHTRSIKPLTVATLSRGYGRQTTGFRIADDTDTAETIGDEPLQLYRKFKTWVRVCVGEKRVAAVATLVRLYPEIQQVLLDDAFQHRAISPHLNILLMDYGRPFYEDFPFPAGRLRERRIGARRADAIVVTKCPNDLSKVDQQRIIEKIRPYSQPEIPIFFAGLHYDQPLSFASRQFNDTFQQVVLVTGLANAKPLEKYVRETYHLLRHYEFADHYVYTRTDLDTFIRALSPTTALLTTEKDWVKLDALLTATERMTYPFYYLPVAVQFLDGQEAGFVEFLDGKKL